METFLAVLIGIALLSVLAVLLTGVVSMAKGGEFNRRHGNRLMRWRVALQGTAVVLIIAAAIFAQA